SSSVFCPSNRSSSRIRSLFSSKRRSCPEACAAFCRNCAFQEANNCGLIWCSRQTSAAVLAPLKTSSTTRALNSALNARRFRMTFPFLGLILLHLQTCPSFGAHYTFVVLRFTDVPTVILPSVPSPSLIFEPEVVLYTYCPCPSSKV